MFPKCHTFPKFFLKWDTLASRTVSMILHFGIQRRISSIIEKTRMLVNLQIPKLYKAMKLVV